LSLTFINMHWSSNS